MLRYRIKKIEKHPEKVFVLTLEPLDKKLAYLPGQFAFIHLLDEKGESLDKRPYSIASSPTENNLEFCIKMINGRFTSKLEKAVEGKVLGIEGPLGHFVLEKGRCGFIAGGVGIAPFMSMLRYVDAKNIEGDYRLFYCARKKSSLIYYSELLLLNKNKNISVHFSLTRETPENWEGLKGRFCGNVFQEHTDNPKEYRWYICGPVSMTKAVKKDLAETGVPENKVKAEGWG